MTYNATVTSEEAAGSKAVTNTVVLSDNGAEATDSTTITNGQFSFTKTDARAMLWPVLSLRSKDRTVPRLRPLLLRLPSQMER